jgi:hypothetical protein
VRCSSGRWTILVIVVLTYRYLCEGQALGSIR